MDVPLMEVETEKGADNVAKEGSSAAAAEVKTEAPTMKATEAQTKAGADAKKKNLELPTLAVPSGTSLLDNRRRRLSGGSNRLSRAFSLRSILESTAGMCFKEIDEAFLPRRRPDLRASLQADVTPQNFKILAAATDEFGTNIEAAVDFCYSSIIESARAWKKVPHGAADPKHILAPNVVMVFCTATMDAETVLESVRSRFPNSPVQGATSCNGVMSLDGFHSADHKSVLEDTGTAHGLGIWVTYDVRGSYVTLAKSFEGDGAQEKSMETLTKDLQAVVRDKKGMPFDRFNSVVWITGSPGTEEALLDCVTVALPGIQVVGGSCADNGIKGKWKLFSVSGSINDYYSIEQTVQTFAAGYIITLMQPGVKFIHHFLQPYVPVPRCQANVSKSGNRTITELKELMGSSSSALVVYRKWADEIGLVLPNDMDDDSAYEHMLATLANSTRGPIGIKIGDGEDDAKNFLLVHPCKLSNGEVSTFAEVDPDQTISLMQLRDGDLLGRIQLLETMLRDSLKGSTLSDPNADVLQDNIAGALCSYCAGCMLEVNRGDGMRKLSRKLSQCYGAQPFLAFFPFGEQGFFSNKQRSLHGNLMFASLVFLNQPAFEQSWRSLLLPPHHDQDSFISVPIPAQEFPILALHHDAASAGSIRPTAVFHAIRTAGLTVGYLLNMTRCARQPCMVAMKLSTAFARLAKTQPESHQFYSTQAGKFAVLASEFLNLAATTRQARELMGYADESILLAVATDQKEFIESDYVQRRLGEVWKGEPLARNEDNRSVMTPRFRFFVDFSSYLFQLALLTVLAVQAEVKGNTSSPFEIFTWVVCVCDSLHDVLVYQKLQQLFPVSNRSLFRAIMQYFESNLWRVLDLIFLILLPILVVAGATRHDKKSKELYRAILSLVCVTAYLKIMPMTLIHRTFGPLQLGIQSLFKDIFNMLAIMIVAILAFTIGFVNIAKIDVTDELYRTSGTMQASFLTLTHALFSGDLRIEFDKHTEESVTYIVGNLMKIFFGIFGSILTLNLLIAIMTLTWNEIHARSIQEWRFLVATGVLTATFFAPFPAPLNVPWMLIRPCRVRLMRFCCKRKTSDKRAMQQGEDTRTYKDKVVTYILELHELNQQRANDKKHGSHSDSRRVLNSVENLSERVYLVECRLREQLKHAGKNL